MSKDLTAAEMANIMVNAQGPSKAQREAAYKARDLLIEQEKNAEIERNRKRAERNKEI